MNTTIKDVAKLAGVHPSTVSRVINNDSRISEKTKNKVLFIINKLGYTPNAVARGLKTKRTYTIGMLVPDITNPFFAEIARGVEDAANERGFNVILCNTDEKIKKEITYLNILKGKRVDGLILGTAHVNDKSIFKLEKSKFPYILIARDINGLEKNCVIVNDVEGGVMATEHLIKLGHRKIAHIAGSFEVRGSIHRLEGYKRALKKHKIEYKEELVEEGDLKIQGGYQAMKKLLKLTELPTAIFAANDLLEHCKRTHYYTQGLLKRRVITIIMDGENAWEYYNNNGVEFLETVYAALEKSAILSSVTPSEFLSKTGSKQLERLAPGSWINSDFSVWIGSKENNRNWDILKRIRKSIKRISSLSCINLS